MTRKSTQWNSKAMWIGRPGPCATNWTAPVLPAPFFRKVLTLDKKPETSLIKICGLGYYELYINGKKVGDHVLDPLVTHYDKRARYVTYDVSGLLVPGANTIGVILGNGWYNSHTPEVWHFDKASWRAYPKLLLQMDGDGACLLTSDQSWKCNTGPIVFDGLRNGETYDANLELEGWLEPDYDDADWMSAMQVQPPGGELEEQTSPSCKIMKTLEPKTSWNVSGGMVFDLGQNIAGWARITVSGDPLAKVTLTYGERLDDNRRVDQFNIGTFVKMEPGNFQTDRYILNGEAREVWEPRFTYHGFQYVQVAIEGRAKVEKLEGRVVHTSFDKIGRFECSNDIVNRLQSCTEWSYIGNFVGIPTDCPHREKNGWTGDAQLAAETGLFNYEAASSYAQWIDSIVDAQRPNGQLPGIVPSTGWGYNWGSGPAWDSALILIPWYVYVYTGDDSIIKKHYQAMKKYIDYCTLMADDHIASFGLGDWCHADRARIVDRALTDTGYYFMDTTIMAKFAEITERDEDHRYFTELASRIKEAFNQKFYNGEGIYAKGEQTAMGCALYQGLVDETEKEAVLRALVKAVEDNGCKPDFGILGAKYIPRVLADNGHAELAYQLITQPEYPGWVNWLNQGATTLWESWLQATSRNHIMYGDISAWFYQYLAGITPDMEKPGFKHFIIKPHPVEALNHVKAEHRCPYGVIKVDWRKDAGKFKITIQVPETTTATLILPDNTKQTLESGEHTFMG